MSHRWIKETATVNALASCPNTNDQRTASCQVGNTERVCLAHLVLPILTHPILTPPVSVVLIGTYVIGTYLLWHQSHIHHISTYATPMQSVYKSHSDESLPLL